MELLEHRTKRGFTPRQVSVASSGTRTNSLGKPIEKPYYTTQDVFMIFLSLLCLFLGIMAVAYVPLAGRLGQKNQLVLLGLLLSLMSACTQKQTQLLLITLEARFGASTLQDYDSILRYGILDRNVNWVLRVVIGFMLALPLVLSASYKQFVGGTTTIPVNRAVLDVGPVGPPGLLQDPLAMMLNVSLPFLRNHLSPYRSDPLLETQATETGSFGFNVHILSQNTTALLDAPLASELTQLQTTIGPDETLEISTYVNATICHLNSTSRSPERADPDYWITLNQSLLNPSIASYGTGLNFASVAGEHDYSFVILSLWDTRKNETYESEAIGFNIYRGQCHVTWQINQWGTITITDASNCTLAPHFSRPCMHNTIPSNYNVSLSSADALQTPLTCNAVGATSLMAWPLYDLLWLQPVSPVWVAAVASTAWAELAYRNGPASETPLAMLKYPASTSMTKTIQTLHKDRWSLYLVLAVQPILLLASFLGRMLLYSTPVSDKFGLVSLLAGVSRDSLDLLRGAAFSGELRRPVRIRIVKVDRDDEGPHGHREASIEYELDAQGKHDSIEEGTVYG